MVAGLAATMAPNVTIFLDFDRTIASTKCGADPLIGSHSIDASLLLLKIFMELPPELTEDYQVCL